MKTKSSDIDFAPNVKWMSSKSTAFTPRVVSEVGKILIALYLLRMDEGFQHLLRQCVDKWIVSLTVGKRTAYTIIYDYANFVDKQSYRGSSPINVDSAVVVGVDRTLNIEIFPKEDMIEATSTGGILHASRCLTDFEIGMCDAIGRSTIDLHHQPTRQEELTPLPDTGIESLQDALDKVVRKSSEKKPLTMSTNDLNDILMRLMQLNGRRWTNNLDVQVEEIIQASRLKSF